MRIMDTSYNIELNEYISLIITHYRHISTRTSKIIFEAIIIGLRTFRSIHI